MLPVVRIAVVLGLLASVAIMLWALQGGINLKPDGPRIGAVAPDFALNDLRDQRVSLASARGRPVIVNFWATWCIPCKAEMPAIDAVSRANPNAVVLAVNVYEGPVLVQMFVRDFPVGFVPLLDTEGKVSVLYKVNSIPTSFFIGPDGIIRAINVGPMDRPMIEQNLRRAT